MKLNGLIATSIYLSLIALWIYLDWQRFCMLAPNEWGDFLAGTIGPLALLWVVLSFWLQSNELQNSVNALQLQAEELKNSVEQQIALVEVSKNQLDLEVSRRKEENLRLDQSYEVAEKDRIERNAPEFLVRFDDMLNQINGFRYTYSLFNRSGDAHEVQITILNGNDLVHVTPRTTRGIPNGTKFDIVFTSDQSLVTIDKLTLIIHSWGADRTLREQIFTWSSNEVDLQESHAKQIKD